MFCLKSSYDKSNKFSSIGDGEERIAIQFVKCDAGKTERDYMSIVHL